MRARRYFSFAIFCALFAIFLRVDRGNWLREQITHVLGFVARAAVEHLLVAIAIPIVLAFFAEIVCWRLELSRRLQKLRGIDKSVPATLDAYITPKITFYFIAGIAVFYAAGAFGVEWRQAYESVYGGPPRGYIQWEQVAADIAGSMLAVLVGWRFRRAAASTNPTPCEN